MEKEHKSNIMLSYAILKLSAPTYKALAMKNKSFREETYNKILFLTELFTAIKLHKQGLIEKLLEEIQNNNIIKKIIIYICVYFKNTNKIEYFLFFLNKYQYFSSTFIDKIEEEKITEMKEEIISEYFYEEFNNGLPKILSIYRYSKFLDKIE